MSVNQERLRPRWNTERKFRHRKGSYAERMKATAKIEKKRRTITPGAEVIAGGIRNSTSGFFCPKMMRGESGLPDFRKGSRHQKASTYGEKDEKSGTYPSVC